MKKQTHHNYLVRWEMEVIAASPIGAARNALIIQRDSESLASVFTVSRDGERWQVDLIARKGKRVRRLPPRKPRPASPA